MDKRPLRQGSSAPSRPPPVPPKKPWAKREPWRLVRKDVRQASATGVRAGAGLGTRSRIQTANSAVVYARGRCRGVRAGPRIIHRACGMPDLEYLYLKLRQESLDYVPQK